MIHTRICDLLGIRHPIVMGGMAGPPPAPTSPGLVAAVCEAGGLGTLGLSLTPAEEVEGQIAAIRSATDKPFAVNFLMFPLQEQALHAALEARPPIMAFAWARQDQALDGYFDRAKQAGCTVVYQAPTLAEARRAAEAGADVIVAQGTEGGGHVGWMASMPLVPMIVDAVSPIPVLAAGGIADGRGLAAALALGADGALLGTRFLATEESPLHVNFKQAIVESDGHDTLLSEIPDVARGRVWPGAMSRARHNAFISRWAGREWALRAAQPEVNAAVTRARLEGDIDEAPLWFGQDAGLIDRVEPVAVVMERMVSEAEALLGKVLPGLTRGN